MAPHETDFVSTATGHTAPPNIVFLMADDLGWADLGCYGSDAISTPNIDRLAAQGVRFTHGYAGSPFCSSTRIALYTGQHPCRLQAGIEEPMQTRSPENGIPADHPTLPSLLKDAGYDTAMFGKWHCGWLPWHSPIRIGFDTFFGNLDGALDYFEHVSTLGEPDLYEGETPVEMTGYYTDIISEKSAEYIAASGDQPFYVQVNYTAPHWPWEGRGDADVGARIRAELEEGSKGPFPILHLDGGSLAKYAELVEAMDDGIGIILDALDAAGKADNTIVVFCSDNGGERWSNNWPFVGEKGDLTEGGIRVPFIVRWPEAVAAGQVTDHASITQDWTATLLAAGGATPHPDHPLDGVDLLPWLVDGADYPEHDLLWRLASQGAVRRGRFKYVRDLRDRAIAGSWPRRVGKDGHYELLYDVTVDGREAADIAPHHPDVVAEMREAWLAYDADLIPYTDTHPNVPRHATADRPAVSLPD
ncbi:MAG: sulfatase-like hydrolase/transferase [Ilumatobacter sp.]